MPVEHWPRPRGFPPLAGQYPDGRPVARSGGSGPGAPREKEVFTVGGCRHGNSGTRAGFGVYWGEGHPLNTHKALPGAVQTAQRAEVAALLWALQQAQSPIKVWSDSKYTVHMAHAARGGRRRFPSHPDLWESICVRLPLLDDIGWVKAHLNQAEAATQGFPGHIWQGNLRADTLPTAGVGGHSECRDGGEGPTAFHQRYQMVRRIHRYLLSTQRRLGALELTV